MIIPHKRPLFWYVFAGTVAVLLAGLAYYMMHVRGGRVSKAPEEVLFRVEGTTVKTLYGTFTDIEPVILDLIESPAMQRIKLVHQYGVMRYINGTSDYSRYAHCFGTWVILRRFGAPLAEQIAGLLHDVSHTVFSHLGDFLYKNTSHNHSYQDDIHEWFLCKMGVDQLLAKHDMRLEDVLHKSGAHTMLEQDLPDLCADRIEYNLRGGLVADLCSEQDITKMLEALQWGDGHWFFTDQAVATQFARIPLNLTVYEWGSPGNYFGNIWSAQAINRAMAIGLMNEDDVHFSTDDLIWDRLALSDDKELAFLFNRAKNCKSFYTVIDTPEQADKAIKVKFRGVNPLVRCQDGSFARLADLNASFKDEYDRVKALTQRGWLVKFLGDAQDRHEEVVEAIS